METFSINLLQILIPAMRYYPVEKSFLIIGAIIFCIGLVVLFFSDSSTSIGIFGAGFASFTGAYAAFMFEDSRKLEERYHEEKKKVNNVLMSLLHTKDHICEYIDNVSKMIENKDLHLFTRFDKSVCINLDQISFIFNKDTDLLNSLYTCANELSKCEGKIENYNTAAKSGRFLFKDCLDDLDEINLLLKRNSKSVFDLYHQLLDFYGKNYSQ